MTTRTIRTLGRGYGLEPAEISVQVAGITVYRGTVPTYDEWPGDYGAQPEETLFDFEIDLDQHGTIPMQYHVATGRVVFGRINGNYVRKINPVFTSQQVLILQDLSLTLEQRMTELALAATSPFTTEEFALLVSEQPSDQAARATLIANRGLLLFVAGGSDHFGAMCQGDARSNVRLDGRMLSRPADPPGTWSWLVDQGQILEFDVNIGEAILD